MYIYIYMCIRIWHNEINSGASTGQGYKILAVLDSRSGRQDY